MSMDPSNPYSPPSFPGGVQPPLKPVAGMDYMRMLSYIFENPNWFMNCLLSGLCMLIPIIGSIVMSGYQFEVAIGLILSGGARYPDFDFNRFGDYLMRGLWPFLAGLVLSFGIMLILGVLFGAAAAVGAVAGNDAGQAISGGLSLLIMLISPVFFFIVQPMLFRAALTMDFGQAFQIEWVKDYLQKIWLELLLGFLFWYVASMVLSTLGTLACCVGLIIAIPAAFLAQAHLMFQVYSIYLSRGGTPVPIKMTAQPGMMPPM